MTTNAYQHRRSESRSSRISLTSKASRRLSRCSTVYNAKVVLVGEATVGKTCLVLRFVTGNFDDNTKSTLGVAHSSRTVTINDGTVVELDIWDTAGQERFQCMAPIYYRGANAAILVYDITRKETFREILNWANRLRDNGTLDIAVILVGNKADLGSSAARQVDSKVAEKLARENGFLFYETSAVTGQNVEKVFSKIAEACVRMLNGSVNRNNKPSLKQTIEETKERSKQTDRPSCC